MTQTPEEIAAAIVNDSLAACSETEMERLIVKAIRHAVDLGRMATKADANECGLWCPNCGAHLRAPEVKS